MLRSLAEAVRTGRRARRSAPAVLAAALLLAGCGRGMPVPDGSGSRSGPAAVTGAPTSPGTSSTMPAEARGGGAGTAVGAAPAGATGAPPGAVATGGADAAARSPGISEATLARLTEPGCCPLPFWSPDGRTVLFFDRPDGGQPGVYGVPVEGGEPRFVAAEPVATHLGGRFTTSLDAETVTIVRTSDGRSWQLDTDGSPVTFAPDGRRVAWVEGIWNTVPGRRPPPGVHRVTDLDGGPVRTVDVPYPYVLSDWTGDGAWLLAVQDAERDDLDALVRMDPATGATTPVFDGNRLSGGRTSPDRRWLAIARVLEEDPGSGALFVVSTEARVEPQRLDVFGGWRWRDGGRLLVVPIVADGGPMTLLEVEAATGATRPLTDPARLPFRIAAGEWSVSPAGTHVAFRSAEDDAIWVMGLP